MRRAPGARSTERLTVAWVAALAAIAVLAVAGAVLVQGTLARQTFSTKVLAVAGSQQARSVQLGEAASALVATQDEAAWKAALRSVSTSLPTFEDNHRVLRFGDLDSGISDRREEAVDAILVSMEPSYDTVVAAARSLLHLPGSRPTGTAVEQHQAMAADLVRAEERYRAGLRSLIATWEDEGLARASETERVVRSILVATLALLVIEAFLVFRPATRRVREALVEGHRAQENERARSREQLEMLARYDHLTGLANRTLFRDRLERAIAHADRSGDKVAVMFLDLDKFKEINDQYGHDAGDELLVAVAGRVDRCARRTDTVARLGGDEFVLILENLDSPDGAATAAQKILDQMSQPFALSGRQVNITTSIGIAVYPDDADSLDALLRDADSAMYEAKSAGRNTFQFSTPELRATNLQRLQVISDLRRSVAQGDLRLVYQPQIAVDTGAIVGVEAYVRWLKHDGEEVPAAEFIRIAEDTDLMVPLGDWVLREACRQGVAWRESGLPPLRVAVNLSEKQFRQPDLPVTVAGIVHETGFDPRLLEVEVTEDTLVDDIETSSATLHALKAIGTRIVIDDFGTGYSSLSYLRRFPLDALKIDRSFLTDIGGAETSEATVVPAAIAGLARHLGVDAVAEGVETAEHLEFLRRIRVDLAQGWYVGAPVEASEVVELVRRNQLEIVATAESAGA